MTQFKSVGEMLQADAKDRKDRASFRVVLDQKPPPPPPPPLPSAIDEKSIHDAFFQSYSPLYNYDPHIKGYVVGFFTTPSINTSLGNLQAMGIENKKGTANFLDKRVIASLCYANSENELSTTSKFIKSFSNLAKGFPLDDLTINETEGWNTKDGRKFFYGSNISNQNGREFSVNFKENKELTITKTALLWQRYISDSKKGRVSRRGDDIKRRVVDYTSSLYVFVLEPDGETIQFWSKDTGLFPKSTPISSLGTDNRSDHGVMEEVSVAFKSNFYEVFSTDILADFQSVTSGSPDLGLGETPLSTGGLKAFFNRLLNSEEEIPKEEEVSLSNYTGLLDEGFQSGYSKPVIVVEKNDKGLPNKYKLKFTNKIN